MNMANLNIRNVSDELYHRVRAAAACGAPRIPKGALEKWVKRALLRAVESHEPGLGAPRLKFCAGCFLKNQSAVLEARSATAPPSTSEVATRIELPAPAPVQNVFADILSEDGDSMAEAGMLGAFDDVADVLQEIAAVTNPSREAAALVTDSPLMSAAELTDAIEVSPGLWVGDAGAFEHLRLTAPCLHCGHPEWNPTLRQPTCTGGETGHSFESGWAILSAAKEPWHRQMVGYETKSAPEGPERLVARRGKWMALNLIDVREIGPGGAHYVSDEAVQAGLDFIHERLEAGNRVLLHDGKGVSAAPAIAMLYMIGEAMLPLDAPWPAFKELYPVFDPKEGMRAYLQVKGLRG